MHVMGIISNPSLVHSGSLQRQNHEQSFSKLLLDSLEKVNALQLEADRAAVDLAVGRAENLHQVMLAGEKAQLALQLTLAVRNKVVEAYQELSRMQI